MIPWPVVLLIPVAPFKFTLTAQGTLIMLAYFVLLQLPMLAGRGANDSEHLCDAR